MDTTRDGGRQPTRYALGEVADLAIDLAMPPSSNELIAHRPLLSDSVTAWPGTAVLVRATDRHGPQRR